MKIEYILIKGNDDFCKTIDQFKSFLKTNCRISLKNNKLFFSEVSFSYSLSVQEVKWKSKKEIVFYFIVTSPDDNDNSISKLEEFDKLLCRVNQINGNQFSINTIWDEVSMYYAKKLYPEIIKIENMLRKIIYRFMIKTAGSSWFDSTMPENVRNSISETLKKNDLTLSNYDQLYFADFIQLGIFFFQPYSMKPRSDELIKQLKSVVENNESSELNKKKIMELIELYGSKSSWDRYFADKITVENLSEKWNKLYAYRNQVAHTKRIKKDDYLHAKSIIDELNTAFDKCLSNIDSVTLTEEETEAVQEVAKETVTKQKPVINKQGEVVISLPEWSTLLSNNSQISNAIEFINNSVSIPHISENIFKVINSNQSPIEKYGNILADYKIQAPESLLSYEQRKDDSLSQYLNEESALISSYKSSNLAIEEEKLEDLLQKQIKINNKNTQ